MMIPIDKMSTTDKVIESIRSYIQEPGRNPGEKLPTENELGKQLGVGRSSIREALRVGGMKKLTVMINCGMRVMSFLTVG